MIRWLRSAASVLRRLFWPMPKDLRPDVVSVAAASAHSMQKVVWRSEDGTEFEFDASLVTISGVDLSDDDDLDDYEEPKATDAKAEPEPPPASPKPQRPAGRQLIQMPGQTRSYMDILAGKPSWPGIVAKGAHRAPWEDLHTFPGRKPIRDDHGLHGLDDPLAFTCPGCDLDQPPVRERDRDCPYCGLKIRLFGSYLVWWREAVEPALRWPPVAKGSGR